MTRKRILRNVSRLQSGKIKKRKKYKRKQITEKEAVIHMSSSRQKGSAEEMLTEVL